MAYSLLETRLRNRKADYDRVARNYTAQVARSMDVPFYEGHGKHLPVKHVDTWFDTPTFTDKENQAYHQMRPVIGRAAVSANVSRLQADLLEAAGKQGIRARLWLNPALAYCPAVTRGQAPLLEADEERDRLATATVLLRQLARYTEASDTALKPWTVDPGSQESFELTVRSRKRAGARAYSACLRVHSSPLKRERRQVADLSVQLGNEPAGIKNVDSDLVVPLVNLEPTGVRGLDEIREMVASYAGHEALERPLVLATIGAQAVWLSANE